jgi:hypothetical protein
MIDLFILLFLYDDIYIHHYRVIIISHTQCIGMRYELQYIHVFPVLIHPVYSTMYYMHGPWYRIYRRTQYKITVVDLSLRIVIYLLTKIVNK